MDRTLSERYVIDLTKPWHVSWWADYFRVTEESLSAAVALVGPCAAVVGRHLGEQKEESALVA
jgi:hypothetical protein